MALNNWMASHKPKKLCELVMPASHDAGTIAGAVEFTKLGSNSNTVTQDLPIPDQLGAGTRFFDLRFSFHHGKVVPHHTTLGQGGYGTTTFEQILDYSNAFCQSNPSEVVILRISHTDCHAELQKAFATMVPPTTVGGLGVTSRWPKLNRCTGNLCTKTIAELTSKGGLILILAQAKFGQYINQAFGRHSFSKFEGKDGKKAANQAGIATCGEYDGGHTIAGVIDAGKNGQSKHSQHKQDHLWQVYWQKTYKNPWSSTGINRGTHKQMSTTTTFFGKTVVHGGTHATTGHMLELLQNSGIKTPSGRPLLPNIWSYDFVNKQINNKIIALNDWSPGAPVAAVVVDL